MQENTTLLHAKETGLAFSSNDVNAGATLTLKVTSCEDSRAELIIEASELNMYSSCEWVTFDDVIQSNQYTSYRTLMEEGGELTLTFPDHKHNKPHLNNAYAFYLGDGVFSIISHENINITKHRTRSKYAFSLPRKALATLKELEGAEPSDEQAANLMLKQALETQETLHAYSHERMSKFDSETMADAVAGIKTVITKLTSAKRRLKKQPTYEAMAKTLLIEKLQTVLSQRGESSLFARLESEAKREALSMTSDNSISQVGTLESKVISHVLHSPLSPLFENKPPPPLPISKCLSCEVPGKLEQSISKSRKKRFEVYCPKCEARAPTSFSHTASGAIINWNTFTGSPDIAWCDITVFSAVTLPTDGKNAFLKSLLEYIDLQEQLTEARMKIVDSDALPRLRSIKGKLNYLRDARVLAKMVIRKDDFTD